MRIEELLNQLISPLSMEYKTQESIKLKLKQVILARFLAVMAEKYSYAEEYLLLKSALEIEDIDQAERVIADLFRSEEYKAELTHVVKPVLTRWAENVHFELTPDQQAHVSTTLALI